MVTKAQQAKIDAKSNESKAPAPGNGPDTVATPESYNGESVLKHDKYETTLVTLGWPANVPVPPKVFYLIRYGWTQSITDAAAFSKEQKAKFLTEHAKDNGPDSVKTPEQQKAILDAKADAARQKRMAAIIAGEVGTATRGPRLDAFEKMVHTIALERITAKATEKGKPLPKGDVLKGLVLSVVEKQAVSLKAEATARMERNKAESDDLDSLFDDVTPPATPTPDATPGAPAPDGTPS